MHTRFTTYEYIQAGYVVKYGDAKFGKSKWFIFIYTLIKNSEMTCLIFLSPFCPSIHTSLKIIVQPENNCWALVTINQTPSYLSIFSCVH